MAYSSNSSSRGKNLQQSVHCHSMAFTLNWMQAMPRVSQAFSSSDGNTITAANGSQAGVDAAASHSAYTWHNSKWQAAGGMQLLLSWSDMPSRIVCQYSWWLQLAVKAQSACMLQHMLLAAGSVTG
jgi:hypothetical protein